MEAEVIPMRDSGDQNALHHQVMYACFIRNYDERGNFASLEEDLERIRSLGVDLLWLLPIHPIGEIRRKGTLGSPYAIRDYRAIHPDYGDVHDFKSLLDRAHELGLRVLIDVVFNHTSPDAVLYRDHPEYYYRDSHGAVGNRIGEWSDVIDLDYREEALWPELIDVLVGWAELGVDGFRCDVAQLVPLAFWKKARQAVAAVNPDCLWLAETFDEKFVKIARDKGVVLPPDAALAEVFDLRYDYDSYPLFRDYLDGKCPLSTYIEGLKEQDAAGRSLFLRFLENHDQPRAHELISERRRLEHWTAMKYLERGTMLLYNGQEALDRHRVSLFDRDPVDWSDLDRDYIGLLNRLYHLKKDPLLKQGAYRGYPGGQDRLLR
jgi:glycosidase